MRFVQLSFNIRFLFKLMIYKKLKFNWPPFGKVFQG